MISHGKEERNAKGVLTKRLYCRYFDLEYWALIEEIKKTYNVKTNISALKFALKKATNRI